MIEEAFFPQVPFVLLMEDHLTVKAWIYFWYSCPVSVSLRICQFWFWLLLSAVQFDIECCDAWFKTAVSIEMPVLL